MGGASLLALSVFFGERVTLEPNEQMAQKEEEMWCGSRSQGHSKNSGIYSPSDGKPLTDCELGRDS